MALAHCCKAECAAGQQWPLSAMRGGEVCLVLRTTHWRQSSVGVAAAAEDLKLEKKGVALLRMVLGAPQVTVPYLKSEYGKDFDFDSPVRLLDKLMHGQVGTPGEECVVLAQVLASNLSIGYEDMVNTVVSSPSQLCLHSSASRLPTRYNGIAMDSHTAAAAEHGNNAGRILHSCNEHGVGCGRSCGWSIKAVSDGCAACTHVMGCYLRCLPAWTHSAPPSQTTGVPLAAVQLCLRHAGIVWFVGDQG